jgi:hypothetical protein
MKDSEPVNQASHLLLRIVSRRLDFRGSFFGGMSIEVPLYSIISENSANLRIQDSRVNKQFTEILCRGNQLTKLLSIPSNILTFNQVVDIVSSLG